MTVSEQFKAFRAEVDEVCRACGRDPQSVMVVAVSKTVDVPEVEEAAQAGAVDFGENRPDELMRKCDAFPRPRWHFIGNLQSRRIADIVPRAYLIHSVFEIGHLAKIDAAARYAGKIQNILLEINSGEEQKGGIPPEHSYAFMGAASRLSYIRVSGLMTMAPQGDLEAARACFAQLRELRDELAMQGNVPDEWMTELSMGMTEDWRVAIEEGASIIRVGRAIF